MIAHRNRVAAGWTCVVGAAGTAVAAGTHGADGVWSVLLGLVLVLLFLSAGSLPFAVAGDGRWAALAFVVLGLTYVLRLLLGVMVYGVATSSADLDRRVIGLSLIACALTWTVAHVVLGVSRRHAPSLDA